MHNNRCTCHAISYKLLMSAVVLLGWIKVNSVFSACSHEFESRDNSSKLSRSQLVYQLKSSWTNAIFSRPFIAQCLNQALASVGPNHRRPNSPHQTRTTTQDQPPTTFTHDMHPRHSPSTSTHDRHLLPPPIFQYLHHILCLPNRRPVNHFPCAQTPHLLSFLSCCFIANLEHTVLPTYFFLLLTNLGHLPGTTIKIPKRNWLSLSDVILFRSLHRIIL